MEELIKNFLHYIWIQLVNASSTAFSFYFTLTAYIFTLGLVGDILVGTRVAMVGLKRGIYILAPGVVFHELSHAVIGTLMDFKINKAVFFNIKKERSYLVM